MGYTVYRATDLFDGMVECWIRIDGPEGPYWVWGRVHKDNIDEAYEQPDWVHKGTVPDVGEEIYTTKKPPKDKKLKAEDDK